MDIERNPEIMRQLQDCGSNYAGEFYYIPEDHPLITWFVMAVSEPAWFEHSKEPGWMIRTFI
jgi:hypothetical protein